MTIFFTSDHHFGHAKILDYCGRPFKTVLEMNNALIDNWNARVQKGDTVYYLGDFCFGNAWYYIQALKGNIKFIIGSHDKPIEQFFRKWHHPIIERQYIDGGEKVTYEHLGPQHELKIGDDLIVLNHYSMRRWPRSHHGSYHLWGHSHATLGPYGRSMDVGVDTNNFQLYTWEELKNKLEPETWALKSTFDVKQ